MFQSTFALFPVACRFAVAAFVAAVLVGCSAVGPNFHSPEAQSVPADHPYTPEPMPSQTTGAPVAGGAVQRFTSAEAIPAQWWTLFRSEPLDRLVRTALTNSPTVSAAEAALRQAQESYNAQYGARVLPSVTGQFNAARERSIQFGPTPSIFTLYNASVAVSYTVDAFGGVRRELEALGSVIEYQRFQLEAAH